jgi:hypothetical protein
MDNEKFEAQLIDYIDGRLSETERREVEEELMRNDNAYKLYEQLKEVMHAIERAQKFEPSRQLKEQFDKALDIETASSREKKSIFLRPVFYRVAAAVTLLVLGGGVGFWISKHNAQQQEVAMIKKQLDETKLIMMTLIDNQLSASQRIQGVNVAMTIEGADDEVVQALVRRMNDDPNTNVRLAALEALGKFLHEPVVKKALVQSLSTQKDPVVQIALIQLMVRIKEKTVIDDLRRMVDDEETMKAVKDEAYTGLLELS